MRTLRTTLLLASLMVGATLSTARAQKGLEKSDYYNYLLRSGRAQTIHYPAGPVVTGLGKVLGPEDVKLSTLDIGNVRARIRNTGTLGYDRDGFCYEFPFNSGITYRWTLGPMIAGKKIINGEERKMVSGAAFGAVRGTSEDEYRPLKGFDSGNFDLAQNIGIAFSDKPASWPSKWPTLEELIQMNGSYVLHDAARDNFLNNPLFDPQFTGTARVGPKGFPGVSGGETRAPREAYFVITDNDPSEPGSPIPMDVRVDVWGLQWDDFVNRNFIIYRLAFTNIGDQTLTDVYVGIHDDPDAPEQGSNEWTDDLAYLIPPGKDSDGDGVPDPDADPRADVDGDGVYTAEDSLLWNTLYLWDSDDKSEGFLASNVGWVGLKFLETPNDPATGRPRGITTLDIFQYTAAPTTDPEAYDQMAGCLHVGLPRDDPQQGCGTPIIQPDWPDGYPGDVFQIPNSYGPDITVVAASGPFTLEPGQTLYFTFASVHGTSQSDLLNNAKLTQILFNNNYKSAAGPPTPHVVAVPGDGKVTLYWDDTAEKGIYPDGTVGDPLTGNNAFEGYKVFRSDDGGKTWGEPIVDINGSIQGYIPLAVYDLVNGIQGESETRRYFDLGSDTGLRHMFVDENVENGKEYLYAVVAYDHQDGPVPPLETPINVANPDAPGDNTVRAIPMPMPSGLTDPKVDREAAHVAGNSDVTAIPVNLVDPYALVTGNYEVTFSYDDNGELTYTVTRDGQVVTDMGGNPVQQVPLYDPELDNAPIFNGVRLTVQNVDFDWKEAKQTVGSGLEVWQVINTAAFGWGTPEGLSADYKIVFTEKMWTYADYFNGDAVLAPFEVYNMTTGQKIHAEIRESDVEDNGVWDPGERIYIVNVPYPENEADAGQWLGAWPDDYVYRVWFGTNSTWQPGDEFVIISNKPLTPEDRYAFQVRAPELDKAELAKDIEEVTVVPNPFVVSSEYEKGAFGVQRVLQFHQLPEKCTIRIYTVAGELVQVIEHDGGSIEPWNLLTYNGQEVAFGVYLYYIETPEGITKTGKFAIIK